MALIKCPECRKKISSNAVVCPNCGEPIQKNDSTIALQEIALENPKVKKLKNHNIKSISIIIAVLVVLVVIITVCFITRGKSNVGFYSGTMIPKYEDVTGIPLYDIMEDTVYRYKGSADTIDSYTEYLIKSGFVLVGENDNVKSYSLNGTPVTIINSSELEEIWVMP